MEGIVFVLSDTIQSFQKQRLTFAIILFSVESAFFNPLYAGALETLLSTSIWYYKGALEYPVL